MEGRRLTRRRLIGAGAAAGAGAVIGAAAPAAARHRGSRRGGGHDVAVVGGGFAGLTAAREIARTGHTVILLESRDRVGGRVFNHDIGGGEISEGGGTFAGPTQDRVLKLAKEMKVKTFDTYDTGDNVY